MPVHNAARHNALWAAHNVGRHNGEFHNMDSPRGFAWAPNAFFAADLTQNRAFLSTRVMRRLQNLPGISITRATTGYALTQQGQLVQFPSGAARITDRGLLVEGAATNLFLNSTAPVTQDINFASTGQRTLSVWGSGSVAVAQNSATITGAGTATQGSPVTFNVTATGTCTFTVTGTPTIVQVEATAYATSPIATAGASATRNADVIAITGITGLTYANGVTMFAEFEWVADTGIDCLPLQLDAGTATERVRMRINGTNDAFDTVVIDGGLELAAVAVPGALAVGTIYRAASRAATNNVQSARGGTLGTADTAVTMPNSPTSIRIGANSTPSAFAHAYLRRLAVFPSAYTDAQLQAITS